MRPLFLHTIFLVIMCVINSMSQVLMRWGAQVSSASPPAAFPSPTWLYASRWWLAGLFLSWFCGLGWAWLLRALTLSYAVPIYVALVYALSLIGAWVFLHETISKWQSVGIALVFVAIPLICIQAK